MCGICGWIDLSHHHKQRLGEIVVNMTDSLSNRGPDDSGTWTGKGGSLGHRRLAVLDPLNNHQPMINHTSNGDVVLVYSGEIYNFRELKEDLLNRGYIFQTNGDTEVVLYSYLEWGGNCIEKFAGMFALAIWDVRSQQLLLARDRFGIKPLYYFELNDGILFGSEPKAILSHPEVDPIVDTDGLRQIFGLIRSPGQAVYKGMHEVKPGHLLKFSIKGLYQHSYWTLKAAPHLDDLKTTISTTKNILSKIVSQQLVSDVSICTLLSGGLDSSTLTALAQQDSLANGNDSIQTFSVSFGEDPESFIPDDMRTTSDDPFIKAVVNHVGSTHKSILVAVDDLLNTNTRRATLQARDLPNLGEIDSTLYLLFKAIRNYSTVAISGEGADELFGGYRWFHNKDIIAQDSFPWLSMARTLGRYSMFEPGGVKLDIANYQADLYADAIRKIPIIESDSPQERRMRQLRYLHLTHFLPTPLERKDRMSMAVGLEVRVPFIDHRLVEYVFNIPWSMMTFDGHEKSILRAVSNGLLPSSVSTREKSPFPATQDSSYHAVLNREVKDIIAKKSSPILDLMNISTIRALTAMPTNGLPTIRMGLERILSVHEWLTKYRISIQI